MNKIVLNLLFLLVVVMASAQSEFITTWKTDNEGISENNQITIPTFSGETYDYTVDWGDGTSNTDVTGDITHTYGAPGVYEVSITGTFPRIYFNESGDKDKILNIKQWGAVQWSSMESAFARCSNLSVAANDVPDLSNVTSLRRMFFYCKYAFDSSRKREYDDFNGIENFNDWDVSTIADMSHMFDNSAFNQDISAWDVSNVIDMSYLFFASHFNQEIGNWDVSQVQNMEAIFSSGPFQGDVTKWDVSSVTNMAFMFYGTYFDQDISSWDVGNVTNMRHMLSQSSFNQDISNWDIGNVNEMANIFEDNDLSRENYDKILIAWSQLPTLQFGINLGAQDVQYCLAKEAREILLNTYYWSIVDQGQNCEAERPFITTWKTDNPGPSRDNQITIPTNPREVYNYNVDWGDGTSDTGITEDITHTYTVPGTYQVSITGRFPRIYFNNSGAPYPYESPRKSSDTKKIISVDQWGTIRWNSMSFAFAGCENLDMLATDIPDFSKDIHLSHMFYGCSSLVGNRTMSQWDLSDISLLASSMFAEAVLFNQPIGQWDVSSIRYLDRMFHNATSFDQNLENWDIGKVEDMKAMFDGSAISTANYDKILNAWSALPSLVNNVKLGAINTNYCNSEEARQELINTYGWEITDAGKDCSSTYFITTWKTDNPGVSEDNQIIIPTFPGETYDYVVDWGDGTSDAGVIGDITHDYEVPGTYQVSISGDFPRIYFNDFLDNPNDNDSDKIIRIEQWGEIQWASMNLAFAGCENLDITATDIPDLRGVTSLRSMFMGASSLVYNESINNWDTSNIEDMAQMFSRASLFNRPIGSWNVSNVTDMGRIFQAAENFNQDIGTWDVGNVRDMQSMFIHAKAFDQDIGNWNVGNVTIMSGLFWNTSFNQNIGRWNTNKVTTTYGMFVDNVVFNQDIGGWDVSSVTNMGAMFVRAFAFNQDLSGWDVGKVANMESMFENSGLTDENYDKTLIGWNDLQSIQNDVILDAGNNQYCVAAEARQNIIDTYGWIINDGGEAPFCNEDNDADGVLDHLDHCLHTAGGAVVDANGCEIIPANAISIYGQTPTCVNESNGSIEISSILADHSFTISVVGATRNTAFTNVSLDQPLKIENLSAGLYTITIEIPEAQYEQTFGATINEVNSVTSKRQSIDTKNKTATYLISGSYQYRADINGKAQIFTFDSTAPHEIVLMGLGDYNSIAISGKNDCQGKVEDTFIVAGEIFVYPVITSGEVFIYGIQSKTGIKVYDMAGRMIIEKDIDPDTKEGVNLEGYGSGMYPIKIISGGTTKEFKVIKQ